MPTIEDLRRQHGMTQAKLAAALNVAPSTVYTWEADKHIPDVKQLRKLAGVFGVPMEDIRLPKLNGKDDDGH